MGYRLEGVEVEKQGRAMSAESTTIEEYVRGMRKAYPIIWINFQLGIDRYNAGEGRPYDNYWKHMSKSQELYRLGWDMARRDALLSNSPSGGG